MLLKIFKSQQPVLIFLIPIIGIAIWLPLFFNLSTITLQNDYSMPLSEWILNILSGNTLIYIIIALVLNIINAFLFVKINAKYILISDRGYLTVFMYLFLSTFIIFSNNSLFIILSITTLLIVIEKVFHISKDKNQLKNFFESGFLISIASLFYFNSYIFILIVFIALIMLRQFYWREYFITLIGFILPYLFIAAYYFIANKSGATEIFYNKILSIEKTGITIKDIIIASSTGFFFILSFFELNINLNKKKINTRKYYKILLLACIIPVIAYFILPTIP